MIPSTILVEAIHQDRVGRFAAEAYRLRLLSEARAGRRETAPTRAGSPRNLGGLQAVLAAMTRLWSAASS
jgi:hypothetical protein